VVKKNKTFFFLSLMLFILIISPCISSSSSENKIYIDDTGIQYLESGGITWRAGGDIGGVVAGTYFYEKPQWYEFWMAGKRPDRVRIYLENNIGENKFVFNDETTWGETSEHFWVRLEDPNIQIPAFAESGPWKLKITFYSNVWILENKFSEIHYVFSVGQSSIVDNLFAPIYIFWDSIPLFGSDDVGIALPGIIYITMFVWIPLLLIGLVIYFRLSTKIGLALARRFKGGKKNGKKKT